MKKARREAPRHYAELTTPDGMQIKLPKTRKELAELLRKKTASVALHVRREAQDEVLYLQGKQSQRFVARNDVQAMSPVSANAANIKLQELPAHVMMTFQELARSNAQLSTAFANLISKIA